MAYNKNLGYDPDFDYSDALAGNNLSAAERERLTAERQAKINTQYGGNEPAYTAPSGVNTGKTFSELQAGAPAGTTQISYIDDNGNKKAGYIESHGFDPDFDYSDALANLSLSAEDRARLEGERQAKINAMYGGAEPTFTNAGGVNTGRTFSSLYTDLLNLTNGQNAQPQTLSSQMQYFQTLLSQYEAEYQQAVNHNNTTYAAQLEQTMLKIQQQIDALNRQYQGLNKQLYVDYMNSRKNLPQQLAAMGYTGGLSESGMLGLETGYQGQLAANERERLTGINDLKAGGLNSELELKIAQAQANQDLLKEYNGNRAALYAQMAAQQNYEDEQRRAAEDQEYERQLYAAQLIGSITGDYNPLLNMLDYAPTGGNLYTEALTGGGTTGGSFNNGGLTTEQVQALQRYYGVTPDGLWGSQSTKAAGGLGAADAWTKYQAAKGDGTTISSDTTSAMVNDFSNLSAKGRSLYQQMNSGAMTQTSMQTVLDGALSGGSITQGEYNYLTRLNTGSTGLSTQSYNMAGSGIIENLRKGNSQAAVNTLDAIWPELSETQRQNMRNTLAIYDVTYEP